MNNSFKFVLKIILGIIVYVNIVFLFVYDRLSIILFVLGTLLFSLYNMYLVYRYINSKYFVKSNNLKLQNENDSENSLKTLYDIEVFFIGYCPSWCIKYHPFKFLLKENSLILIKNNLNPSLQIYDDFISIKILKKTNITFDEIGKIIIIDKKHYIETQIILLNSSYYIIKSYENIENELGKELSKKIENKVK